MKHIITTLLIATCITPAKSQIAVLIFPNPFIDTFNISVSGLYNDNVHLKVYDVYGIPQLDTLLIEGATGSLNFQIPFINHVTGPYFAFVDAGSQSEVVKITKQNPTGFSTLRNAERLIFPNPSRDFWRVILPGSRPQTLSLLDTKGRVVWKSEVNGTVDIPANSLPEGAYFLISSTGWYQKLIRD